MISMDWYQNNMIITKNVTIITKNVTIGIYQQKKAKIMVTVKYVIVNVDQILDKQ